LIFILNFVYSSVFFVKILIDEPCVNELFDNCVLMALINCERVYLPGKILIFISFVSFAV